MTSRRIACVTPMFWPAIGHTQTSVMDLVDSLHASGQQVTIFTPKLEPDWAAHFMFHEVPVHRIERTISRPWSRRRYARSTERLLRQINSDWDAIVVCGVGEELNGIAQANPPLTKNLFLRLDHQFVTGQAQPPLPRPTRQLMYACQQILYNCNSIAGWLAANGFQPERVHFLPDCLDGHAISNQTDTSRDVAREVLADLNPLLNFDRNQPIVLCGMPMLKDAGWFDLLNAWQRVRRALPRAQLVLAGDGPHARSIWNHINSHNLQGSIIMPGWFDDWSDLILAADVYVHPASSPIACPFLLRAMASGVCTLSTDFGQCDLLSHDQSALLIPSGREDKLADTILLALRNPELRTRLGQAGRSTILSHRSRDKMAAMILDLIDQRSVEVCGTNL